MYIWLNGVQTGLYGRPDKGSALDSAHLIPHLLTGISKFLALRVIQVKDNTKNI
jgi:hypothetical protein